MLKQRVITAVLLLAIVLPAIFVPHAMLWPLVSLAFCAAACWEWVRMLSSQKTAVRSAVLIVLIGLSVLTLDTVWQFRIALGLACISSGFWLFIAPIRLSQLNARPGGWPLAVLLILSAWFALVQIHRLGPWILLAAMAIVWIADIGAYFVGRAIGKRKLALQISPGKSWEGAWGGLFFVIIIGLLSAAAPQCASLLPARLVSQTGPLISALALALLSAYSVIGDLHESLLKRQANVKDSSKLLPGHGGVLDRIDALLPTMPMVYLMHHLLEYGFRL